jgi:C-terminal processing protease CtpA/Prc
MFTEVDVAVIRPGELTQVTLRQGDAGKPFKLHPELGSGLSFENSPGGVRVDFVMNDCPAAKAGVQLGDLIVSIGGVPTKDSVDAFERMRKPDGAQVVLVLRRQGVDQTVTVR